MVGLYMIVYYKEASDGWSIYDSLLQGGISDGLSIYDSLLQGDIWLLVYIW